MTRYLTIPQILFLHARLIEETGGSHGLRELGLLEAANARPQATFGGACRSNGPTIGGLVATTRPMRLTRRIKKALPCIVTSCQYNDIPGSAGGRLR